MAQNEIYKKVVILGSGPAGLTAAIYASRAQLEPLVVEGPQPGGQLMITTDVENYPGFAEGIMGPALMDEFRKQATRFGTEFLTVWIDKVDLRGTTVQTFRQRKRGQRRNHDCHSRRNSGDFDRRVRQMARRSGRRTRAGRFGRQRRFGVRDVRRIFLSRQRSLNRRRRRYGDGRSLIFNALCYESDGSASPRRFFRASKIMQERVLNHEKIEVKWHTEVREILGTKEEGVTGVKIFNNETNEESIFPTQGVFIAIGHKPNTELFKDWLELNDVGYIQTKGKTMETNIEGVFACGDAQDHYYRQAITAAGTGCMAAIDAERFLVEHGEARKQTATNW